MLYTNPQIALEMMQGLCFDHAALRSLGNYQHSLTSSIEVLQTEHVHARTDMFVAGL